MLGRDAQSAPRSGSREHFDQRNLWLDSVVQIAQGAFAIVIFNSLSFSHTKGFTLDFFCPWRCLNDKMSKLFTPDTIEKKEKRSLCSLLSFC